MKHILETLKAELEKGKKAVLCTVIDNSGSCPRGKGAHMLVSEQSKTIGTVGGGRVEYETEIKAKELLKTKENFIQDYRLCPNEVADIGMICGGNVTILFQYMDQSAIDFCDRALALINKHEDAWIVARISSDFKWDMGFYTPEDGFESIEGGEDFKPLLMRKAKQNKNKDGSRLYAEPVSLAGQVYLFGGGHVAQAVAPLLHSVGFRYTLYEEREQFASPDLFPDAERIVLSGFDDIAKERIYAAIDAKSALADLRDLKESYRNMAYRLGRQPMMMDFVRFGDKDPAARQNTNVCANGWPKTVFLKKTLTALLRRSACRLKPKRRLKSPSALWRR